MGDGSGLSHVKQGFDAFDSGDHSGQNREHNFVSRATYLTDPLSITDARKAAG